MPEYDFVYAKGEGKAALKLQTQNVAGKLAAGSLFTGGTGSVLYLDEFAFLYPAKK